jgi:ABC-2 type transport system ATP-binding protein
MKPDTHENAAIVTCGLIKSYGSVQALRGVDLEVKRGEIFGFLGPNGSGKTTTIRCLLDLIRPAGGTLRVLGIDPQVDPVTVRARAGYLPGELRIDDAFTVEQALRFFSRLRRDKVDWHDVRELSDRLNLDLTLPIKNLSKGNKQKVGIVQALMHRPELLVLDEPTAGLDPLMQQQVLRAIREAKAQGATVFFSSHVLSEVQEIADRVGIIRRGQVVEVAETQALINRAVRQVFVRFKQPIDLSALTALPGVKLIDGRDSLSCLMSVEGDMDRLIKTLAGFPVSELETERPSLEEVFLAYYEGDRAETK